MSDDSSIDVLVAFGIGVIAGAAAALLLAPTSGEDTRRRIGDTARDAGDQIRDRGRELSDQIVDKSKGATDLIREQTGSVVGEVKSQADRVGRASDQGKKTYGKGK